MDFLGDYGLFLAQLLTVLVVLLALVVLLIRASSGGGEEGEDGRLEIKRLDRRLERFADTVREQAMTPSAWREHVKARKKRRKEERKRAEQAGGDGGPRRVYVLDFDGDLRASAVESLREEISAVLSVARSGDEVLLRLESSGGLVHAYGLAASQLDRLREHGLRLTAAVDKVAASGGYLMACVADRILAAPFAVIGSIGVAAELPNFHRFLEQRGVDFEQLTAGEHKRTLSIFGENTEAGRRKAIEELEEVHGLFKGFVGSHRGVVDPDEVGTGEYWLGSRALELNLVDELRTSDEHLLRLAEEAELYAVRYREKHSLPQRLGMSAQRLADRLVPRGADRIRLG